MKKKLLFGFLALAFVVALTGCGKKDDKEEKKEATVPEKFSIVCTGPNMDSDALESTTVYTYTFNKEQYVTSYKTVTTQKYSNKKVYETYKKAQSEAAIEDSDDEAKITIEADDEKLILIQTMTMDNIDVNKADEDTKKEDYKASAILKTSEAVGYTCKLEGVERSQIK